MRGEAFLDGRVTLHCGDSRDVLRTLPDASIHAVVTDPPYALVSIQKRFGKPGAAPAQHGTDGLYARASAGFMGQSWDTGETAFAVEFWSEVLRVLKPGGHVVAFGGTRTVHRLAVAIEDAGFQIRDTLFFLYGTGFPKSHNISKKAAENICRCGTTPLRQHDLRPLRDADVSAPISHEVECSEVLFHLLPQPEASVAGWPKSSGLDRCSEPGMEGRGDLSEAPGKLCERALRPVPAGFGSDGEAGWVCDGAPSSDGATAVACAASDGVRSSHRSSASEQCAGKSGALAGQPKPQDGGAWPNCERCGKPIVPDGLGTALKPAVEPIILARKPLEGTVAANVLAHGTGALNIDGCRIEGAKPDTTRGAGGQNGAFSPIGAQGRILDDGRGRWPANVLHDGSPEVVGAFPDAPGQQRAVGPEYGAKASVNVYGDYGARDTFAPRLDQGSAARFFYSAKADADDRLGSKHPTVKPVDLMQWLVRLVCPPGGVVLDPFAGTGTTGEAAWREGFSAVLIEREAAYQDDIRRRMGLCLAGPAERKREGVKARHGVAANDAGPLFGGGEGAA